MPPSSCLCSQVQYRVHLSFSPTSTSYKMVPFSSCTLLLYLFFIFPVAQFHLPSYCIFLQYLVRLHKGQFTSKVYLQSQFTSNHKGQFTSKLNCETVPVLPSLIFPFHLSPSPVHPTEFSFCFFLDSLQFLSCCHRTTSFNLINFSNTFQNIC